jgi:hypothetical protein
MKGRKKKEEVAPKGSFIWLLLYDLDGETSAEVFSCVDRATGVAEEVVGEFHGEGLLGMSLEWLFQENSWVLSEAEAGVLATITKTKVQ